MAIKCGALFGEALVINAEDIKYRFKAYMKQNGAVLAKGYLMGLQFCHYGLRMAIILKRRSMLMSLPCRLKRHLNRRRYRFGLRALANQQFVILSDEQKKTLAEKYYFEEMERTKDGTVVRFCTSWCQKQEEVDATGFRYIKAGVVTDL